MNNQYTHKETWSRRGKDFLIEVVRWETMTEEIYKKLQKDIGLNNGRYVWNIYCYIYSKHKLFDAILGEEYEDCPVPFHGGCTLSQWNRKQDGTVTSKQYGCDYNHYQDEHFTFIEKPEEAYEVFNDAEEIFNELSERND